MSRLHERSTQTKANICVCVHIYKCWLLNKCQNLVHSLSTALVTLGTCWGCCAAGRCWVGPTDCFRYSGLVRILYIPRLGIWGRVSGSASGIPPRWQLRWGQKLFTSVAKNAVSCWQSRDESLWFWVKGRDLPLTAARFYFQICSRFRCLALLSLLLRKQGGIQKV